MAREKKWDAVGPLALTEDGGADGKLTVADTCGLHTKQLILLKSTTTSRSDLEIKKVISETEFLVGPKGGRIDCYVDVSAFTIADVATVQAPEQPRPKIPPHEIERSEFEEEPIVAKRTVLVDQLGRVIKYADGKLPVEATVTTEGKSAPVIANVSVVDKETEESFTFPSNVIAYEIKLRGSGLMQLSFISGQTATEYFTVKQGNTYKEENLKRNADLTIYFETTKDNATVEIKYWTK